MSKKIFSQGETVAAVCYYAQAQKYRLEHLLEFAQADLKLELKKLLATQENIIKAIIRKINHPELREALQSDLQTEELLALTAIQDVLADHSEELLEKEEIILKNLKEIFSK